MLVIEDDPYSLINFTNVEYKSLYELNKGRNIVYLGTFSKYISPSINIGYILSNSNLIDKLYLYKESFDLNTSMFNQIVVLDYLKNNNIEEEVKDKIVVYRKLLEETTEYMEQVYGKCILDCSKVRWHIYLLKVQR